MRVDTKSELFGHEMVCFEACESYVRSLIFRFVALINSIFWSSSRAAEGRFVRRWDRMTKMYSNIARMTIKKVTPTPTLAACILCRWCMGWLRIRTIRWFSVLRKILQWEDGNKTYLYCSSSWSYQSRDAAKAICERMEICQACKVLISTIEKALRVSWTMCAKSKTTCMQERET